MSGKESIHHYGFQDANIGVCPYQGFASYSGKYLSNRSNKVSTEGNIGDMIEVLYEPSTIYPTPMDWNQVYNTKMDYSSGQKAA
ncbi:hypothetical protein GCM10009001_06170 [Virgibacillus siamensis]|uniref:Uncharacterized protein n=1 Tax=Virgibacillus siamensis TaxID=480071 RepID=A0ABN1FKQ7_9BACI